jgi:hypothetical protein
MKAFHSNITLKFSLKTMPSSEEIYRCDSEGENVSTVVIMNDDTFDLEI